MHTTKFFLAAVAIAASSVVNVFALAEQPVDSATASGKTRSEVIAEITQAGGNLGRKNYEATFNPSPANASKKTRAEVKEELNESRGDAARNNYRNTTSY
ncbi:hypothetical protein hmeg3_11810 [Herbaspirillum sp. meg3]|uniref:hypothetical protein n=1 Tax=Herbaspirillum sp. meg3 TaxID=2025949 RepID=UPI000B999073|nr:hypothetical protein [Herbaspirillum sp. meg3]ASU41404.1 hypothetical protein hmeg3_11810 [Herbaspirillum sp. meg3]